MKPKNISTIELHVEKVVIGLVGLFLLWVLWAYGLQSRYSIELEGRPVEPGEIDQRILEEARQLESRLRGPAPDAISGLDIPRYANLFRDALSVPVTPDSPRDGVGTSQLAARLSSQPLPLNLAEGPGPDLERAIRPLEVPTPTAVAASTYLGTLAAEQIDPSVLAALPADEPYDLQWVTVAGRFPVDELLAHLQSPPADEMRPIPRSWVDQALTVAEVQIQRRRVMTDGSWSDPELVNPLPGRLSVRQLAAEPQPAQSDQLVQTLRSAQGQVVQPPFYPLRHGQWAPPELPLPGAEAAEAEEADDADSATLRRLQAQLARLQNFRDSRRDRDQPVPPNVTQQISELSRRIDALQRGGGEAAAGRPRGVEPDRSFAPAGMPRDDGRRGGGLTDLFDGEPIVVWSHDVETVPGATYQYRLRVLMTNPLFGRELPNQPEQVEAFTVAGGWSDWTEPVETYRRSYFFLTGANANLDRATIQAWKFHNGGWRMASFPVAPGDPVGQQTADHRPLFDDLEAGPALATGTIDFGSGYLAVDIDFAHKVAINLGAGQQMLTRNTSRLIVIRDDGLESRIQAADDSRLTELKEQLREQMGVQAQQAEQPFQPAQPGPDRADQPRRPTRPDRASPPGGYDMPTGY